MKKNILKYLSVVCVIGLMIGNGSVANATELQPADGQVDDETTVEYDGKTFYKKSNGWYVPSLLVYNGTDLDVTLDSLVSGRKRSIVKYEGYKYIRVSGGWYRLEINAFGGSTLDEILDELAGETTTTDTTTTE